MSSGDRILVVKRGRVGECEEEERGETSQYKVITKLRKRKCQGT